MILKAFYDDFQFGGRFNFLKGLVAAFFGNFKIHNCELVFVTTELYINDQNDFHLKQLMRTTNEINDWSKTALKERFRDGKNFCFFKEDFSLKYQYQTLDFKDIVLSALVQVANGYGKVYSLHYSNKQPRNAIFHMKICAEEDCFAVIGNDINYLLLPG